MGYKALKMKNMEIGSKYEVTVDSGNATVDMQGWDGVHTGGERTILLNGSGSQDVRFTRVLAGWTGGNWPGPDLAPYWQQNSTGGTYTVSGGNLTMETLGGQNNGSGQYIECTLEIPPGDFEVTFDYDFEVVGGSDVGLGINNVAGTFVINNMTNGGKYYPYTIKNGGGATRVRSSESHPLSGKIRTRRIGTNVYYDGWDGSSFFTHLVVDNINYTDGTKFGFYTSAWNGQTSRIRLTNVTVAPPIPLP